MAKWREDPAKVRPMLASLDEPPIVQRGMIYEPKYDGIRALVDLRPGSSQSSSERAKRVGPRERSGASGAPASERAGGSAGAKPPGSENVRIYSRNGNDKTAQFPSITTALGKIGRTLGAPLLIDGEIVAVDAAGRPLGFQYIQGRIHRTTAGEIERGERDQPAILVMFDLLRDGDEDLRPLPMAARRLRLQERVRIPKAASHLLRLSEIVADDGRRLLKRAEDEGWEGLIVKDGQSVYQSGRRTPAWRKKKLLKQQEFVVGGWTEPRQSRQNFGALLVGYYENGDLRWAGSVGTGFNQAELDRVANLLRAREIASSPFADRFKTPERQHWVKPDIVAEVRFTEWTSEGLLRQPVYLGTRTDKKAKDVVREDARPVGVRNAAAPKAPASALRASAGRQVSLLRSASVDAAGKRRPSSRKSHTRVDANLSSLVDVLISLEKTRKDGDLILPNGDTLRVTNLAKVFWPKLGITKGELIRYYVLASPFLLPCVDDRPLVMKRFPNGVDKQAFYQQRHPEQTPPGVRREVLPDNIEPIDEEGPRDRLIGGSLTTLLYMTQLAAISQDPWFSRVADPLSQDHTAIDLDPGDGVKFPQVLDVARWVKDELDRFGIPGVPKTSGSRGLHIYIPLPPHTTYQTGQLLAEMIATIVSTAHPKFATVERWTKKRPRGTVYVDYLQNILGKTLATAYSARASEYAGVSTPLTWQEVARAVDPTDFTVRTAPARFKEVGDLWARLRTGKAVDIKRLLKKQK
ncbi:MAG TPA: DNA ligase D [Vicinamibacterales bacterium]|nr:DNA ligase D [Vicinamibacterales bacterium]